MKKGNRKIMLGLLGIFLLLVGMYVYHMNILREGVIGDYVKKIFRRSTKSKITDNQSELLNKIGFDADTMTRLLKTSNTKSQETLIRIIDGIFKANIGRLSEFSNLENWNGTQYKQVPREETNALLDLAYDTTIQDPLLQKISDKAREYVDSIPVDVKLLMIDDGSYTNSQSRQAMNEIIERQSSTGEISDDDYNVLDALYESVIKFGQSDGPFGAENARVLSEANKILNKSANNERRLAADEFALTRPDMFTSKELNYLTEENGWEAMVEAAGSVDRALDAITKLVTDRKTRGLGVDSDGNQIWEKVSSNRLINTDEMKKYVEKWSTDEGMRDTRFPEQQNVRLVGDRSYTRSIIDVLQRNGVKRIETMRNYFNADELRYLIDPPGMGFQRMVKQLGGVDNALNALSDLVNERYDYTINLENQENMDRYIKLYNQGVMSDSEGRYTMEIDQMLTDSGIITTPDFSGDIINLEQEELTFLADTVDGKTNFEYMAERLGGVDEALDAISDLIYERYDTFARGGMGDSNTINLKNRKNMDDYIKKFNDGLVSDSEGKYIVPVETTLERLDVNLDEIKARVPPTTPPRSPPGGITNPPEGPPEDGMVWSEAEGRWVRTEDLNFLDLGPKFEPGTVAGTTGPAIKQPSEGYGVVPPREGPPVRNYDNIRPI